ncbi:hypothetical protein ACFVJ4_09225 [Streptomyces sp. NPDC127178]|uniref:hypothetical protein n=1 Tax=unclassified Streptomyces TaxID=2593676 RepID=UPI00362724A1
MSAPADKASGKLWDGALDAQHTFGDLDGHRPALLAVHDDVNDGTAYRAELSVSVDAPVLSDGPILQQDLPLPDSWWTDLTGTLEKVAAVDTPRDCRPAVFRWTTCYNTYRRHSANGKQAPIVHEPQSAPLTLAA